MRIDSSWRRTGHHTSHTVPVIENKNSYDDVRAAAYVAHHEKSARTKITTRRERNVLRKCLRVGAPGESIGDLACGAGRFWPTIAQFTDRIVALDLSPALLRESLDYRTTHCARICGSMFALPFRNDAFDTLVCMRFMHHLGHSADRVAVLDELHRVARKRVIISLWSDGSIAAARRLRKQAQGPAPVVGFGKRRCTPLHDLERDFAATGWQIRKRYAVWPLLSMWQFIILEKSPTPSGSRLTGE